MGQQRYTSQTAGLVVSLGLLPAVNSFRVILPAATPIDAGPGDPGDAAARWRGGRGNGADRQAAHACAGRVAPTEVMGADGGADLAAVRPAATYRQQAAREVIQALASDAGVDTADIDLDLPMAAYVADQSSTAGEHIAGLSRLAGAKASMNGDGALMVGGPPSGPADLALLYGREIIEYRMRQSEPPRASRVAIGNGPAGSADAPDALQPSKDVGAERCAGPGGGYGVAAADDPAHGACRQCRHQRPTPMPPPQRPRPCVAAASCCRSCGPAWSSRSRTCRIGSRGGRGR